MYNVQRNCLDGLNLLIFWGNMAENIVNCTQNLPNRRTKPDLWKMHLQRLAHKQTLSLIQALSHSVTHLFTHTQFLPYSITHSLTSHLVGYSLIQGLTHSTFQWLNLWITDSLTGWLKGSVAHKPNDSNWVIQPVTHSPVCSCVMNQTEQVRKALGGILKPYPTLYLQKLSLTYQLLAINMTYSEICLKIKIKT